MGARRQTKLVYEGTHEKLNGGAPPTTQIRTHNKAVQISGVARRPTNKFMQDQQKKVNEGKHEKTNER